MTQEKIVIKTGRALGEVIDGIIRESFKSVLKNKALEEKDKQDALSSDSDNEPKDQEDNKQSATMSADSEDVQAMKQAPEYDDIVEKLNAIRSGHSLRDESIAASFQQYFSSLKDAEKVALFVFLKGIAQVLSAQVPGDKAIDPGDAPADVQMKKGDNVQKKSVKPNVIKEPLPSPDSKRVKSKEEDTTAPVQVKKRG